MALGFPGELFIAYSLNVRELKVIGFKIVEILVSLDLVHKCNYIHILNVHYLPILLIIHEQDHY